MPLGFTVEDRSFGSCLEKKNEKQHNHLPWQRYDNFTESRSMRGNTTAIAMAIRVTGDFLQTEQEGIMPSYSFINVFSFHFLSVSCKQSVSSCFTSSDNELN